MHYLLRLDKYGKVYKMSGFDATLRAVRHSFDMISKQSLIKDSFHLTQKEYQDLLKNRD